MIKEIAKNIGSELARKKDSELRWVLDKAIPTGWTLADVEKRCRLVRHDDSPIETLCVDGKPVLEIHPVEIEQEPTETGWVIRVVQKYGRINVTF